MTEVAFEVCIRNTGTLDGFKVQSAVDCFTEFCFLQFSVALVLVGLRKRLKNKFVFSTVACAAGYNNNSTWAGKLCCNRP